MHVPHSESADRAHNGVQVQDKALDVLSKHLLADQDALHASLPLIKHASTQHAVSVRKRALDILWTSYIGSATFASTPRGRDSVAELIVYSMHLATGARPSPSSESYT